ncbi:MAG: PDZ domain-containing protein [Candidatus Nanopelagicales bacterium]|nr:PDZ domain-containing protein [Candidatus Nanopelagicales bacterium]
MSSFLKSPMSKRARVLFISGISMMVLLLIALLLPVPFVRMAPGPTFNVIGERDGKPMIEVSGTTTYPVTGQLRMVTVMESGGPRGGLTFVTAIASWFNADDAVVPRELVYPDDVSGDDVKSQQAAMFSSSETDAISAAMNYLDEPTSQKIIVAGVGGDAPATGKLEPGDVILAVNGVAITDTKQVSTLIQAQPVGTTFTFTVERDGKTQDVQVTSAVNPQDNKTPYIGISVGVVNVPNFDVKFNVDGVGGPSAGLMLSIGLIDKLTPGDLAQGKDIAGTGTITPEGAVGSIGGIRQKLAGAKKAGAQLFLVPAGNCAEAQGHIPDGLAVTPVKTLTDGMNAVEKWTSGQMVPACPVQK